MVFGLMLFSSVSVSAQNLSRSVFNVKPITNKLTTSLTDFLDKSRTQAFADDNKIMRPLKEDVYSFHQGDWFLESNNTYLYDAKGRRTQEVLVRRDAMGQDVYTRFTLKYNEDGMLGEFLEEGSSDNKNWLKLRNTFNVYDAVRKNIQTEQIVYVWDDATESWTYKSNDVASMFRDIKRDAQGRVTLDQMWNSKEMETPYMGFEFKYGETGDATSMVINSPNDDGYLMMAFVFEDLVWHKTNHQHLRQSNNVYHTFTKDPENQIKSYTLYACDAAGNKADWIGNYEAKYDDQDRLVRVNIRIPYDMGTDQKYTSEIAYDTNGKGSVVRIETNWVDVNDNDICDLGEEIIDNTKMTSIVDDKGNLVSEEWFEADATGNYTQLSGFKYETTYNEYGEIKERITYSYNPDIAKYENFSRVVYSDFIDVVAGIEEVNEMNPSVTVDNDEIIVTNADGAKFIVCDLEGRVVKSGTVSSSKINISNLTDGFYLVRVNGKNISTAVKVIKD